MIDGRGEGGDGEGGGEGEGEGGTDLIIERQFTENGNVLCPFDEEEKLLLHGLANGSDGGHLLTVQIVVVDGRQLV